MPTLSVQILTVGPTTLNTLATLGRLVRSGWSSHSVATVGEAETVLKTVRFNVVLAAEKLVDGLGYDLVPIIGRQGGTLYIGVALSETCLWLPVVERGVRSLGERAMNVAILESEVAEVLRRVRDPINVAAASAISAQLRIELVARAGAARFSAGEQDIDVDAMSLLPGYPHAVGQQNIPRSSAQLGCVPSKTATPPRRKLLNPGAVAAPPLPTPIPDHSKPGDGALAKRWRG
jgi:hypothetical protein